MRWEKKIILQPYKLENQDISLILSDSTTTTVHEEVSDTIKKIQICTKFSILVAIKN